MSQEVNSQDWVLDGSNNKDPSNARQSPMLGVKNCFLKVAMEVSLHACRPKSSYRCLHLAGEGVSH